MKITLDPQLAEALPGQRYAWALYDDAVVEDSPVLLAGRLEKAVQAIAGQWTPQTLKEHPGVAQARQAFRALGEDPARYRPAQEALMRRAAQGKKISFVNTAVDANNLLSLESGLAMGIYDADKIEGDAVITMGQEGLRYVAINGRSVDTAGKLICRDERGPIGSAYVDSVRTKVNHGCRRLVHVVYLLTAAVQDQQLQIMANQLCAWLEAKCTGYVVLS